MTGAEFPWCPIISGHFAPWEEEELGQGLGREKNLAGRGRTWPTTATVLGRESNGDRVYWPVRAPRCAGLRLVALYD